MKKKKYNVAITSIFIKGLVREMIIEGENEAEVLVTDMYVDFLNETLDIIETQVDLDDLSEHGDDVYETNIVLTEVVE